MEEFKLSKEDLDLCRQWFNNVQDVNPQYLERADFELAHRIYLALGMRPSNSITDVLGLPPAPHQPIGANASKETLELWSRATADAMLRLRPSPLMFDPNRTPNEGKP